MNQFRLLLICLLFTFNAIAQEAKNDVVLKLNGDELVGKVTEINENTIRFVYQGETLSYVIKKEEILKIRFASGRIEFFNKPESNAGKPEIETAANTSESDHHNKVAILPFGYIKNSQSMGDEMSIKAQSETYDLLKKHSAGLTMIDPRTTNVLLAKAGIDRNNLKNYTMDEICHILDVEYVVDGTITQNLGSATTTNSGSFKNSGRRSSLFSTSSSSVNYQTSVSLSIYTDRNENIFSENRRALLAQSEGAYDAPLMYLLKRCPLFKK